MDFLVKISEMPTAPLSELRSSKKTCDRVRNSFCLACCLFFVAFGLLDFPKAFRGIAFSTVANTVFIVSTVISIISVVLMKDEIRFSIPTGLGYIAYGAVTVPAGDIIQLGCFIVIFIVTILLGYMCYYNSKLKLLPDYPHFDPRMSSFSKIGNDRERAKVENKNVNPDDFFK